MAKKTKQQTPSKNNNNKNKVLPSPDSKKRKIEEETTEELEETTTTTTTTTTPTKNEPVTKKQKKNNNNNNNATTSTDKPIIPSSTTSTSTSSSSNVVVDRSCLRISQLSPKTLESTLQSCMSEIGPVKELCMDKRNLIALVTFKSELSDEALDFDGATVDDRNIALRFATNLDRRVYLSNLATHLTVKDLTPYLSEVGEVESVEDVTKELGTVQKTVLVQFKHYKTALDSLSWNGAHVRGRPSKWTLASMVPNTSATATTKAK